jgi:hypothetical protein
LPWPVCDSGAARCASQHGCCRPGSRSFKGVATRESRCRRSFGRPEHGRRS